jgi:uncharacterized protein (TIGR04255 family)
MLEHLVSNNLKIPKRISPDSIREAIVEVKYFSVLPFDVLLGMFFNALDETYYYANRQPTVSGGNNPHHLIIGQGIQHIFYNDKISILTSPGSIVFTCVNGKYLGWEAYYPEIIKALDVLIFKNTSAKITKCTRIGVRYISEYPKQVLSDCLKIDFTFGMPEVQSDTYVFRTEFMFQSAKVILTLQNRLPIVQNKEDGTGTEIIPTSSIDVDVILENLELADDKEVYSYINIAHTTEKTVFFKMMKEEFLSKLNPEY